MQNGNSSTPKNKSLDGTIMVVSLYNLVTTTRGMSMTLASLKQD
jgi:hypothetical protein